jgi:hypothetical protein
VEHERPATKAAQPKSAVDHGGPKLDAEMVAKQYEEVIKNLPPTRRYDVDDAKQDKKCEAEYRQIFWTHIPGNYDLDKLTSYAFHNDWYEVCDTGAGGLCRFAGVNRIDENGKLRKTGSPAQPKKAAPLPKMPDGYLSDEWLDACDEWGIDIDRAYAQYVEESRKLKFVMTPDGLAIRLNAALKKAQAEAEEHGFGNK